MNYSYSSFSFISFFYFISFLTSYLIIIDSVKGAYNANILKLEPADSTFKVPDSYSMFDVDSMIEDVLKNGNLQLNYKELQMKDNIKNGFTVSLCLLLLFIIVIFFRQVFILFKKK